MLVLEWLYGTSTLAKDSTIGAMQRLKEASARNHDFLLTANTRRDVKAGQRDERR